MVVGGGGGSQSKHRYIHVSSYFAQRKKRKQPHRIRNFCTLQIKIIETTVSVSLWRIEFVCGARKLYRFIGQHFLFGSSPLRLSKSPFLFFFGYAILKDVSYMLGAKFTGRKFYRWRHDSWPIGQWVIFHAEPDIAYVNHFFPREFIIQVGLGTSSLGRSLRGPHALKLASFTFKNLWEVNL